MFVVVRSPPAALHQPHTYTVTRTKPRVWSTAAVVPRLPYCCCTVAVLRYPKLFYIYCGCEAQRMLQKQHATLLDHLPSMTAHTPLIHTYGREHTYTQKHRPRLSQRRAAAREGKKTGLMMVLYSGRESRAS